MSVQDDVLTFWIDEAGPSKWYVQDDAFDAEIRERFEALWEEARAGRHDDWMQTPEGALALLIVLDQFPRNMFRGTAKSFASDMEAQGVAQQAVIDGHDLKVPTPQRQFFYLPFEHTESVEAQNRAVELIAERMPEDPETLVHAKAHRALIERFGRFPARNDALDRPSTPEEKKYLNTGGYGDLIKQFREGA